MQIILEPVARFQIEMIGRLVQQQQVRLCQQQLGQRDAHLPPAGEFVDLPRPVFLAEAETGKHRADLRIERIAVERMKALLQHRIALGSRLVLGARMFQHRELAASRSISSSIARSSSNTVRHSSKTVRPLSRRPSCGR